MSSRIDAHWDRILSAPPLSLEELESDFPGYSFDTSGWGEDQEIEVTSLPPHMEARVPVSSHPRVNLTSFTTPQRPLPTLDTAYITPLSNTPGTPAPFVLNNSFPPYPPVDADEQNRQLPYVPDITRRQHIAAAADKYMADVGVAAGEQWRHRMLAQDDAHQHADNAAVKEGDGKGKGKEKKQGRAKEDKENGTGEAASTNKKAFNGDDLIMVARAAIDINPFTAPHGQKAVSWQQVVDLLDEQNFRHKTISAASIQHTVEAMISFKKNPHGKDKNLANIIGEGTSASITIGALLERLENNFDAAKGKSDEAKAKLKKVCR
ncbi:hypothetical protein R3P38DRAFT_3183103 [Favolaschia claudopus]|uniref:Uncharacterized protein n=1 Tax=Favolaschia claudopus TaxID=2862362 RepID=A0AAW0CDN1_9AGAR